RTPAGGRRTSTWPSSTSTTTSTRPMRLSHIRPPIAYGTICLLVLVLATAASPAHNGRRVRTGRPLLVALPQRLADVRDLAPGAKQEAAQGGGGKVRLVVSGSRKTKSDGRGGPVAGTAPPARGAINRSGGRRAPRGGRGAIR